MIPMPFSFLSTIWKFFDNAAAGRRQIELRTYIIAGFFAIAALAAVLVLGDWRIYRIAFFQEPSLPETSSYREYLAFSKNEIDELVGMLDERERKLREILGDISAPSVGIEPTSTP